MIRQIMTGPGCGLSASDDPSSWIQVQERVVSYELNWIDWILTQAYLKNPARGHKVETHLEIRENTISSTHIYRYTRKKQK